MTKAIELPFGRLGGPKVPSVRWESSSSRWKGQFLGRHGATIVKCRENVVAKMDEPVEMPVGVVTLL